MNNTIMASLKDAEQQRITLARPELPITAQVADLVASGLVSNETGFALVHYHDWRTTRDNDGLPSGLDTFGSLLHTAEVGW
jgi:hypothetical protein